MQVTVRLAINVAQPGTHTRTVLVLSRDQEWRAQVRRALEADGYQVLAARHPGQALVESTRHSGRIDVLLSDGQGQKESDFPTRILADHPEAKLLHVATALRTRDELLAAVIRTLH